MFRDLIKVSGSCAYDKCHNDTKINRSGEMSTYCSIDCRRHYETDSWNAFILSAPICETPGCTNKAPATRHSGTRRYLSRCSITCLQDMRSKTAPKCKNKNCDLTTIFHKGRQSFNAYCSEYCKINKIKECATKAAGYNFKFIIIADDK